MNLSRAKAWQSADTFDMPPVGSFVKKYLDRSKISIDPFARNKRWCTYTNDINPNTQAEYHMDAEEFLIMLFEQGVRADLIIFDPPYSPRQISECYAGFGRKATMQDTQNSALYARVKRVIHQVLNVNGIVLSFGWNSQGMSNVKDWGYEILEIMLVCHGAGRNDTICMSERKLVFQEQLFTANNGLQRTRERRGRKIGGETSGSVAAPFKSR